MKTSPDNQSVQQHADGLFYTDEHGENEVLPEYPNWIITDMRFPNEMEAVVERKGITIKVTRLFQTDVIDGNKVSWIPIPGVDYVPHASETALDDAEFDYEIINDGTMEELVHKVREILIKENII